MHHDAHLPRTDRLWFFRTSLPDAGAEMVYLQQQPPDFAAGVLTDACDAAGASATWLALFPPQHPPPLAVSTSDGSVLVVVWSIWAS